MSSAPSPVPRIVLRGSPGDCGTQYAPHCAHLLAPPFRERYLSDMAHATGVPRDMTRAQARLWFERLPAWAQEETDGLSRACSVNTHETAEFLYADIATIAGGDNSIALPDVHDQIVGEAPGPAGDGPMCSGVVTRIDHQPWVARNCDWLWATLTRGTAAVVHCVPGRIPVMALGILGDIDLDTGVNAQRLWLHLHTLPSRELARPDRARFSWLFWAREALETCSTIDELHRFILRTDRDRGVLAFAVDGKNGRSALFECGRSSCTRVDEGEGAHGLSHTIVATNHTQDRHPPDHLYEAGPDGAPGRVSRRGSTVRRYQRVCAMLRAGPPRTAPDDLIRLLADDEIEMRDSPRLGTIYAALCAPATGETWFATGDARRAQPAASGPGWQRIEWPW